jgi:hypothetical protein
VNLAGYEQELRNHDWHYDYSDDYRVWERGSNDRQRLKKIAKDGDDKLKQAFNTAYLDAYPEATFGTNITAPFTIG